MTVSNNAKEAGSYNNIGIVSLFVFVFVSGIGGCDGTIVGVGFLYSLFWVDSRSYFFCFCFKGAST